MRAVLLALALSVGFIPQPADAALMFDMGTPSSPVGEGYVPVFADTVYTEERGYGWDHPGERGFSSEWDVPQKYREWHPNHAGPLADAVLTDGVTAREPITFTVDVPRGTYSVFVTVGGYESARHDMNVRIHDDTSFENIDAWGRIWGSQGGSPTKTLKAIVDADGGKIRIEFTYRPNAPDNWREYTNQRPEDGLLWYLAENTNSIVAVRIVPWSQLPVWAEDGKLRTSLERDSHLAAAIARYNTGDLDGASAAVDMVSDEDSLFAKACLLDWIAGNMAFHDSEQEEQLLEKSIAILETTTTGKPDDSSLAIRLEMDRRYLLSIRYLRMFAYSWARNLTGINSYHRYWAAYDLCGPFTPDDPLYFKSRLVRGKVAYWNGREGGWKHCYALAREHFALLKQHFPDDRFARMYLGERVPSLQKYDLAAPGAPEWAVKQREALARISDLIRYWVEERQSENGELGGGWGDDVEILRSWGASVLAVDDPVARAGAEKIANGVWRSGEIENGYSKGIGDVEHASEPVSDTQPLMVATRYGDPLYVERCMQTMKCMRDVWTGRTALGHLHFKSHYFSASEVDSNPPRSADVALNGRAVKPGIWVAWYNDHPIVRSLLEDWSRAWVEDALRTDRGKPAGIVPGSVSFPEDRIGGYAPEWWNTRGYFSNLAAVGYTSCLYNVMLSVYAFGGDRFHVSPILSALDASVAQWKHPSPDLQEGSLAWVGQVHRGTKFTDVVEKWRLLSHDARYDDFLKANASAYVRYLLTGDIESMTGHLQGILDSLSSNIEMSTSEVLFTDRVSMPGAELVFSMMTGGVGDTSYYPLHAVTWEDTGDRLAALVEESSKKDLSVRVYSFFDEEHIFGMRLWRLTRGEYEMTIASSSESSEETRSSIRREKIDVLERGTRFNLVLPPQQLCRVQLRLLKPLRRSAQFLPDLAVGPADIQLKPERPQEGDTVQVSVIVHNIGIAPAETVRVSFFDDDRPFASQTIERLEAPLDLTPQKVRVAAEWIARAGHHRLSAVIDPEKSISEIAELNNRCSREVDVR